MADLSTQTLRDLIRTYTAGFPELGEEIEAGVAASLREGGAMPAVGMTERIVLGEGSTSAAKRVVLSPLVPEIAPERIVVIEKGVRPILRIRENRTTSEFVGPANANWLTKIDGARAALDRAVPAVGRIELTNSELSWAGTAWLIRPDIIVTNRHVVEEFARPRDGSFVFKPGLFEGLVSSDIDFLEEEDRADRNEHPIESILWVSDEDDAAFLRVRQNSALGPLPAHIELADDVAADTWIAAIGYPARDPSIRDQALVRQIFGDVYEKKRLAPGKVLSVDAEVLKHDCSTLGGNSGSVLIDFDSGKAVGLHHGGYLDDSANLAVPVARLRSLLERAENPRPPDVSSQRTRVTDGAAAVDGQTAQFTLNIPVQLVVRLGSPALIVDGVAVTAGAGPQAGSMAQAVDAARTLFGARPEVTDVSDGYRFADGWITDERVIAISVREKLSPEELAASGLEPFPRELMGFGIDVRTAPVSQQLAELGIDIALERPAKPAGYTEPPGFDDPNSKMALNRVRARMKAIFHVSPDSGFPQLGAFLGRVKGHLTASMYEWQAEHISNAIEHAMRRPNSKLRMVTQKRGVGQVDATERAVADMHRRLEDKFSHVWASVLGPQRLVQTSYHIKVASRDGDEFWLSSGNWKDSGQPNIDPAGTNETSVTPIDEHNREWHVIIKHAGLAGLFQRYIEYDFEQAKRFPLPEREAPPVPEVELFVPVEDAREAPRRVHYFDPLELDEELDIQPLLTPDKDQRGRRQFLAEVTALIASATKSIFLQNQSFKYSGDDNAELVRFLTILRDKQQGGLDVRIITRDAKDFGRPGDLEDQLKLIERLKTFGFDVSPQHLKLQPKCHTKGIIVDSHTVVLGSHNLTNGGALFNRDASLIVRSEKVALYFTEIFLHDWINIAHNRAERRSGSVRVARRDESTPEGYKRVTLSEMLEDV